MRKTNKIVKIHISLLTLLYIILILCITRCQFLYGSNVDFIRQHIIFPDYFRNLFYNTGKLIPNFALHLGGGQNIFYFAYYGFLNPIILLSYFLPFVNMTTYLIVSNILLIFLSVLLLYYFLYKNNYNPSICFIATLLFLLSNSLLFHSHRHFMFVNYMPFLLTAFIGVNRYFEKQKSELLITSIFLMILTSFYFSIPGILAVCLYGLYSYIKLNKEVKIKDFFITASKFLLRIFLGIFLSCFFLLPVAFIIFNGRSTSSLTFDLSLFIPKVNLEFLMYGTYGVGLTAILLVALVYNVINKKKETQILSIFLTIICIFPFINCILNGGLYQNGKCFIPFLPLYILLIADMIHTIPNRKKKWPLLVGLTISLFFINAKLSYLLFFAIEIIITCLCLYFFCKSRKYIYFTPILVLAFLLFIITNNTEKFIEIETYKEMQKVVHYDYENFMEEDSIYRFIDQKSKSNAINYSKAKNDYRISSYSSTTNPNYAYAFYNTFNNNDIYRNKFMLDQTNNLFFQRFMGVKYLLTDKTVPYGYEKIKQYDHATLYKTENVYPIGFAYPHILNRQEYEKLAFPEKLEAFGNNIIINGNTNNANLTTLSKKIDLDYKVEEQKNIEYKIENGHYLIHSQKDGRLIVSFPTPIRNNSLIIRFKNNNIPNCYDGDIAITINGITNKLTCATWKYYNENETFDYVLSSNEEINTLEIKFAKGFYDISNLEIYQIPNSYFTVNEDALSPLNVANTYEKDNILSGTIEVKEDGYFLFTIPYDKGFTVLVDGKNVEYELVNEAFIGFKIKKGTHEIQLKFQAPFVKVGTLISGITVILTSALLLLEKKKNCNG